MKERKVLLVSLLVFIYLTSFADDRLTYSHDSDNMLLKVYLQNKVELEGFQCDIILPSGFSVAENSSGIMSSLDGFNMRYKILNEENSTRVRILSYSETTEKISCSNEKEICIIPIVKNTDNDDISNISFRNVFMSVNQGSSVSIDEEDLFAKKEELTDVTYTRDFSNTSWQALYVPFSMNYDDWKDNFDIAYINDVHQYDDNNDGIIERTNVEIIRMNEDEVVNANTPYLIKAKNPGEKCIKVVINQLEIEKENIYSVTSWFNSFNFIGTYHVIDNMATNGYYAMSGGSLKLASSDDVELKPFRWYLSVTDRDGNPVTLETKFMSIVLDDDEATGIETICNEVKGSSSIHTLTGISKGNDVKSLTPGIYIKNGKKFIVK